MSKTKFWVFLDRDRWRCMMFWLLEVEIVDMLAKGQLTERVLTVFPVVKQTAQGTRTRFKVLAAVGDHNGHVGLGIKCYKGDTTLDCVFFFLSSILARSYFSHLPSFPKNIYELISPKKWIFACGREGRKKKFNCSIK